MPTDFKEPNLEVISTSSEIASDMLPLTDMIAKQSEIINQLKEEKKQLKKQIKRLKAISSKSKKLSIVVKVNLFSFITSKSKKH